MTPSELALSPATGIYAGATALSATLTSSGAPVAGRQVNFTLNGLAAGSATTDAAGVATLPGISLAGNAGTYPGAVQASFAGDHWYPAAANAVDLVIDKRATHLAWATPANIIYGTPLGSGQLNATADVAGSIVYSQVAGTVLRSAPDKRYRRSSRPPIAQLSAVQREPADKRHRQQRRQLCLQTGRRHRLVVW